MIHSKILMTADDFGLCPEINEAVCLLHNKGLVHRASVTVNTEYFEECVKQLKEYPNLKIGIHLNLTDGKPASKLSKIVSLTNQRGSFTGGRHYTVLTSILFGQFRLDEIKLEWRSQIIKAKNAGLTISFLNSHGHLHLLPKLHPIVLELVEEFKIPYMRLIFSGRSIISIMLRIWSRIMLNTIQMRGLNIQYPKVILGIDYQGRLNKRLIKKELNKKSHGISEFILHPSIGSNKYHTLWGYDSQSEMEGILTLQ